MTGSRWPTAAVQALACPVCRGGLAEAGAGLACAAGHRFDAARQGYVHLSGTPIRHAGDTADMVAARVRVQSAGLFAEVTAALVKAVPASARVVLDVGGGTGHHLAAVLDALSPATAACLGDPARIRAGSPEHAGDAVGIVLDTSKPALRRAGRARLRVLAVAADATDPLPIADGAIDAVLIAFAPRAAVELGRVMAAGGVLVVVTPAAEHLAELREPLGMLAVGEGKQRLLEAALAPAFEVVGRQAVHARVEVDRATAVDLALMGPAGFHSTAGQLAERAAGLPAPCPVTVSVVVSTFARVAVP